LNKKNYWKSCFKKRRNL